MNVLFTKSGSPRSGSWLIRGIQIANELKAAAVPNASDAEIDWADVVVLVKSFELSLVRRIKARRKKIIYDVLDGWTQPDQNTLSREESIKIMKRKILFSQADLVIAPTQQMAEDVGGFVIYHHARFDQQRNPIRDKIQAIGYEGSARYLEGGWFAAISKSSERRRIPFIVNPRQIADVDIIFAVRGGDWRGYMTDNWKSNVKLANAQATRTPFIGLPEAGCRETASGPELWINEPREVEDAVRSLEDPRTRKLKSDEMQEPGVNAILADYRNLFEIVLQ